MSKRIVCTVPSIYTCKICGRHHENSNNLTIHFRRAHPNEDYRAYYNENILNHTKCKFCGQHIPYESQCGGMNLCSVNCSKHVKLGHKVEDLIKCEVCGLYFENEQRMAKHITDSHKETTVRKYYDAYKAKPGDPDGNCLWCGKPVNFIGLTDGYQKFCYNTSCNVLWNNKHNNRAIDSGAKISVALKEGQNLKTQKGYWLKQGMTDEEAVEAVKDRQRVGALDQFIKRHGEEAGTEKWKERQIKWHNSFKKSNFSKASQEVFWAIYELIKDSYKEIYFAQLDENGNKDESGKNHEYRFTTNKTCRVLDFYIKDINTIIEFDGSYWHGDQVVNNTNRSREEDRDREILAADPSVRIMHVKESDWKSDKDVVIKKCMDFIGK